MTTIISPNEAFLDAALTWLKERLQGSSSPTDAAQTMAALSTAEIPFHSIRTIFRLSPFEQHVLLLAVAPEIDDSAGEFIARAQGSASPWPEVRLAWRLFCGNRAEEYASRDQFRTDAALFRFDLLQIDHSEMPLPNRTLRIDKRIGDALVNRILPDDRISRRIRFRPSGADRNFLASRLTEISGPAFVHLYGSPQSDLEDYAAQSIDAPTHLIVCADPERCDDSEIRAIAREALLTQSSVLLKPPPDFSSQWIQPLRDSGSITFIAAESRMVRPEQISATEWLAIEVARPGPAEQRAIWSGYFPDSAPTIARRYDLSPSEIRDCAAEAENAAWARGETVSDREALRACSFRVQNRMADYADPVRISNSWPDLILPEDTTNKLRELCQQVQHRDRVMDDFGFGRRMTRGRGVSALFAGPSGTGKTMSAEVIAGHLGCQLFRISIPRTVSKYIGDTEKILREAVTECERSRSVLLFDEADAFFGKRTEVKDSHDRFANIQVSYLLQLLEETEHAVLLLATNRREAIDEAFLRRFRFVIDFPSPDRALRLELWRTSFPDNLRLDGIDLELLADRLTITGASIRNIALSASFMAAADGGTVNTRMIALAARRELEKLGRPATLTESDITRKGNRK